MTPRKDFINFHCPTHGLSTMEKKYSTFTIHQIIEDTILLLVTKP